MSQRENIPVVLANSRLEASRIGIGTWAIGGGWGPQPETQSLEAICKALELGCRLLDTAALYGNGRAEKLIAQAFKMFGSRATTLTKIYPLHYYWAPAPGTAITAIYPLEHIIAQVEASLRRLEAESLDCLLFQTWCPSWSQETEWYDTMLTLQKQGKIRSFGISVSDHRPDEANGVIAAGRVDIVEAAYSILDQRAAERLFPIAQRHNVSIIARTPLASGALSGRWHEGMRFHRQDWRRRVFRADLLQQTVQRVARLQSCIEPSSSLAQVALRFCLSHPAVTTVIPGVRSAQQVKCNLAAAQQGELPREMLDIIARLWAQDFRYNVRTSIGEEGEG